MTRTNFLALSLSRPVKVITFTLLQGIWCSNQGGSQNCDYNQNLDTAHANISKYGKTKDFDSAMMIINKDILILKNEFGDTEEEYIEVYCGGQYYYCNGTKFIREGTAQETNCNPSTSKSVQYKHKVVMFETKESIKTLQKVRILLNLPPTLPVSDTTSTFGSKFKLIDIPYFYYESEELLGTLNYKTNSKEFSKILMEMLSIVNPLKINQPVPNLSSDNYISRSPYNPTFFADIPKGVNQSVFIPTDTYILHETSFYYPLNSRLEIQEVIAHKINIFDSYNIACIPLIVNIKFSSNIMRFCNGFYMYLVFLNGPKGHFEAKSKEECTEILTFQLLISRFGFRYEKRTEKPNICVEKSRIYVNLQKLYNLHQTFFYNEKHLKTTAMIGFKDFSDPNDLILVPYIYIEYEDPEEYELFLCMFDDKLILAGFIRIEVRN